MLCRIDTIQETYTAAAMPGLHFKPDEDMAQVRSGTVIKFKEEVKQNANI